MTGDQYTFIAFGASSRAIISYRTGKRDTETTRPIYSGLAPARHWLAEITTDGYHPYRNAIRDAFGSNVSHGVINKTYSVTHLP